MPEGVGAIEHPGIIVDIRDDRIMVKIESVSACASCHAQGVCTSLDSVSKFVEIKPDHRLFHVGDQVVVVLKERQGMLAVVLAYGVPAVLILAFLAFSLTIVHNELLAASISFFVLIAYYTILFLFRGRLKKQFLFEIRA